jgi:hypothetical protein
MYNILFLFVTTFYFLIFATLLSQVADSLPNKLYELKGRDQEATDGFDIIGSTEVYPKKCRFLPGKAEL